MRNILSQTKINGIINKCIKYDIVKNKTDVVLLGSKPSEIIGKPYQNVQLVEINNDGSINVSGDVFMDERGLTNIPLKFNYVSGAFFIHNNNITSLKGSPLYVGNGFAATLNKLKSLEYAPKEVGGFFHVQYNKITSLEHCPVFGEECNFKNNSFPQAIDKVLLPLGSDMVRTFVKYQDYYGIWDDGFNENAFNDLINEIKEGLK